MILGRSVVELYRDVELLLLVRFFQALPFPGRAWAQTLGCARGRHHSSANPAAHQQFVTDPLKLKA